MKIVRKNQTEEHELELERDQGDQITARVDGSSVVLTIQRLSDGSFLVSDGERRYRGFVCRSESGVEVAIGPYLFSFTLEQAREVRSRSTQVARPEIVAPMPGRVAKVMVAEGDRVRKGQPVLVLEAMKMELVLSAEVPGTVTRLRVTVGTQIEAGAVLVEIKPDLSTQQAETEAS